MKTVLLAFTALILTSMAMGQNSIELPAPVKTGGMPLMEALSKRATDRLMDPARSLDEQQLSNLLWAAWGINRPDGRRTAPSALNRQEIDIYLIGRRDAYRYDAAEHELVGVAEGYTTVTFVYARSWEDEAPVYSLEYDVSVDADLKVTIVSTTFLTGES